MELRWGEPIGRESFVTLDASIYMAHSTLQLKNGIHSREEIQNICKYHEAEFNFDGNKMAFLMALAGQETNFGRINVMRHEPAYGPGGLYFQKSSLLRDAWDTWGALVCASYSAHQILYIVCRELGFPADISPLEIWSSIIAVPYVVEFLNTKIKKGIDTPDKLFGVYNAGEGALKNRDRWPAKYVLNALASYETLKTVY